MEPTKLLKKPRRVRGSKERLARIAVAAAISLALVEICQMLPEQYKLGCTIVSKILALLSNLIG